MPETFYTSSQYYNLFFQLYFNRDLSMPLMISTIHLVMLLNELEIGLPIIEVEYEISAIELLIYAIQLLISVIHLVIFAIHLLMSLIQLISSIHNNDISN